MVPSRKRNLRQRRKMALNEKKDLLLAKEKKDFERETILLLAKTAGTEET